MSLLLERDEEGTDDLDEPQPPPGRRLRRLRDLHPPAWAVYLGVAIALYLGWLVLDNTYHKGMPPGVLLIGAVFGSLYGLLAIGIILIYRANRIVNFAQADLGAVAAVLAVEFVIQLDMNYFLAVASGFAMAFVMGAGVNVLVIRRFRKAPRLIATVATIGLAQIFLGISILIPILWEAGSGSFRTPWNVHFTLFPVVFSGDHVMAMVVVPTVMLGLAAFLRYTDYGVAIRAASENGDRASLVGIPVGRLSTIVWAIAGLLSALAVILRVPLVGFTSFSNVAGSGNILLLFVLAAAVLGRMENLPRTVVAAIGIGVFEQGASWIWPRTTLVNAMMVGVILIGLLVQRDAFNRAAETGISTWKAIKEVRPVPSELRRVPEVRYVFGALKLGLLAFVLTVPLWASFSQAEAAALVAIYAIVALSLLMLTGWAGHISLGQFAFVGFGSATAGILYSRHGWDFFPSMLGAAAVGGFVALVIGLPALRIRGPFLAVTTLAFAVTSSTFFLEERYFPWFVNEDFIARPVLWDRLSLDEGWQMYFLALAGLFVALWVVRNLRHSRTGRALIAIRDNEYAAQSVSLNSTRLKLTAFVLSGALAGFAGALYMVSQHGIRPGAFGADVSVRLFSMVVIGGLGSIPGAILGAVYIRGAEFFLPPEWELLASGLGILLLLMFVPEGLGGVVYGIRDWYLRLVARKRGILVPSLLADRRLEDAAAAEQATSLDEVALVAGATNGAGDGPNGDGPNGDGPAHGDSAGDEPAPRRRRRPLVARERD